MSKERGKGVLCQEVGVYMQSLSGLNLRDSVLLIDSCLLSGEALTSSVVFKL